MVGAEAVDEPAGADELAVAAVGVGQSAPPTQAPRKPRGARPSPGTAANSGLSGQMPESTKPITVPAPPRLGRARRAPPAAPALPARRRTAFALDQRHARVGGELGGLRRR